MPITPRHLATTLVGLVAVTGQALTLAWTGDAPPVYGPPGYYPPPYPYAGPDLAPPPGFLWVPPGAQAPAGRQPAPAGSADQAPLAPGASAVPQQGPESAAPPAPGPEISPRDARQEFSEVPGAPVRLRIARQATAEAYLIRIDLGGARPEEVQISPRGQGLAISYRTDAQTVQENNYDDGRGYRRSFSFARGSMSRRLPLPPDADLGGLTRELTDGVLLLRIPRFAGRGFNPSDPTSTVAPETGPNPAAPGLGTGRP